jgi:hypothetical protein
MEEKILSLQLDKDDNLPDQYLKIITILKLIEYSLKIQMEKKHLKLIEEDHKNQN